MKKNLTTFLVFLSFFAFNAKAQILSMPFDGDANDHSGHNNHGIIQGNVTSTVNRNGVANKAYYFPGTQSDFIYIPTNVISYDFNIIESDSFSISLWMQLENNGMDQVIFAKRDTPWTSGQASDFDLRMGQGMIFTRFGVSYNADYDDYNSTNPQNWYHIVLNYNNGLSELYVNDTLRSSNTNSPIDSMASTIIIGRYFKGEIDDINFFEKSLTATEVDNLYRYGSITGISEQMMVNKSVYAYPNPAKDCITIRNPFNESVRLELFDMNGNKWLDRLVDSDTQLDVSTMQKGIYLLKTTGAKKSTAQRIVIN